MTENRGEALLASGFFQERLLVQIDAWEANFSLGMSSDSMPLEYRFQGGLAYTRSFDLHGRVLAPKEHRGRSIRVHLAPLPLELLYTAEETIGVGVFYVRPENPQIADRTASLHMPEGDIPFVATCLASNWKYLHIWTSDEDDEGANITSYSFASTVHRNLDAWIAEE